MEKKIYLQTLENYVPLKHHGTELFKKFGILERILTEQLGEKYSKFFAKPIITYSSSNKTMQSEWLSDYVTNPISFDKLSLQDQKIKGVLLQEIISKIKKFARELENSLNISDRETAEYIFQALEIPDLSNILVEGDKFVLVLWGFQKEIKYNTNPELKTTQKGNKVNIPPINDSKNENKIESKLLIEQLLEDNKNNVSNNNKNTENSNQNNNQNFENKNDNNNNTSNNSNQEPPRKNTTKKILLFGGGGILFLIILFIILFLAGVFMTMHSTGLVFNDEVYKKMIVKPLLAEEEYKKLDSSFSLKPYCPTPGDQGQYGTCVGWSSAYAARTIADAYKNGWKDETEKITENAYSPHFLYKLIKQTNDNDCSQGADIGQAMEVLKDKGVPLLTEFDVQCANDIPANIYTEAEEHKITNFAKIFDIDATNDIKIKTVKKALSAGNPVVIGMNCYKSFHKADEVWNGNTDVLTGGHAMCVIGWDNAKYGGAFEILNSWSASWGNDGYIWVKYADFANSTKYAFEINGTSKPAVDENYTLSALIQFVSTDKTMEAKCLVSDNAPTLEIISESHYAMINPYTSGTKYKIYVTTKQPAYVYVIGSDLTGVVNLLFPHNKSISAFLSYANSKIALPNDVDDIALDNTLGTDYTCILISTEELDIETIKQQIVATEGTFATKINTVLKDKLIEKANVKYNQTEISVEAFSKTKTVVPIIVEMEHK